MLTIDDKRTRAVLIGVHTAFQDPDKWVQRHYEATTRFTGSVRGHCLMGRVAHQLSLLQTEEARRADPTYQSIRAWFAERLGHAPESFNDNTTYASMLSFVRARLDEVEAELLKDAARPPIQEKQPKPSRVAVMLGLFGIAV